MADRRQFLQRSAAAGLCFVGCGLANPPHAHAQGAPRRRQVVVNAPK